MDNQPATHEETIIKRQWIVVIAAFILFAIGGYVSEQLFGVRK